MSTTAMWLLLVVVVVVILFASVLYKRSFTVHELSMIGVMAALSLVAYLFFRVPFYGGSSFHLGNTFTALTALLLGVRGVVQVRGMELARGLDAAISGMAGIGHILLGVGLILILLQVGRSVAAAETKTNR